MGPARLSVRDNPTRTNNVIDSFHAGLRRRVRGAHPNLFNFLGHLQRSTTDNQANIARLYPGLAIRRSKKRIAIMNDTRIKSCLTRYDNRSFSRLYFLHAVSYSLVAHSSSLRDADQSSESDSDINNEVDNDANNDASAAPVAAVAVSAAASVECFEVCLTASRDNRIAVPCGHQRFANLVPTKFLFRVAILSDLPYAYLDATSTFLKLSLLNSSSFVTDK